MDYIPGMMLDSGDAAVPVLVLRVGMVLCCRHHALHCHCVAPWAFLRAFVHITSFENGESRFHQMSLGTFHAAVVCCLQWAVCPEGRAVMLHL